MLKYTSHIDQETGYEWLETTLTGKALLTNSLLNKGTAFSHEEREALGITGKLPYQVETLEQQVERARYQYMRYASVLQKNIYLNNLHDKNEVLFYKLLTQDLEEILPMVYTPGVGSAVTSFSQEFRQPRGIYISYPERDRIRKILENRTHPNVGIFVATDGEGVLGIGDQGIGAIDIPIAKLILYSICGVDPYTSIPIMLDVGTDNKTLLDDPMYLGWRHPRIRGKEYDEFIAMFIDVMQDMFPKAFIHWEDFGRANAHKILDKYKDTHCMFNDDMQGTGVVSLAALLAAIGATNVPIEKQRIVIFGAGTAGIGIAEQLQDALERSGLSQQAAQSRIWLIDKPGLLMADSKNLNTFQKPYAKSAEDIQNWKCKTDLNLLNVINEVHPTILVGCSTVRNAFTQDVVELMAEKVARPIIFPLSNPNDHCEAPPEKVFKWSKGQALIATGSPFDPIEINGEMVEVAQCNNAFSFPGIGLGVLAVQASKLTDEMLWKASIAISEMAPVRSNPQYPLLPSIAEVRSVALKVAKDVAEQAIQDNVATKLPTTSVSEAIDAILWKPYYRTIKPK